MKGRSINVFIVTLLCVFLASCSSSRTDNSVIAQIKKDDKSAYSTTFKDLYLGDIFHYQFKLLQADQTNVSLRIDAYSNGKKVDLGGFSYGKSPNPVVEGYLGFALLNGNHNKKLMKVYSKGGSTSLMEIEGITFGKDIGFTMSGYAIFDDKVHELRSGDERTLAVYREGKAHMVSTNFDPNNEEHIKEAVEAGETLLLFKVKVELIES
jgi:hypothetical protein